VLGTLLVTLIHLSCDFNAVGGLCVNMAKDCQGQPGARAAANTWPCCCLSLSDLTEWAGSGRFGLNPNENSYAKMDAKSRSCVLWKLLPGFYRWELRRTFRLLLSICNLQSAADICLLLFVLPLYPYALANFQPKMSGKMRSER